MKAVKIFATAAVATIIMISCKSKTPQELIVNKWQVTGVSGGVADNIPDSVKESLKKAVTEFSSDGKFRMDGGSIPYEGTYTLSADGKKLTLSPASGEAANYSVDNLTENNFVVTDSSGTKTECAAKK